MTVTMLKLLRETLTLLHWSLLQPAAYQQAHRHGELDVERTRWQGLALALSVPVGMLLVVHAVAAGAHLPLDANGARTFAQISLALASVLCLVGGVTEGVAFGVLGGLKGGFLFFNLYPGSDVSSALVRFWQRFVTVARDAGLYFAIPFIGLYLGVPWYPLEVVWAAIVSIAERIVPQHRVLLVRLHPATHDQLLKLPIPSRPSSQR